MGLQCLPRAVSCNFAKHCVVSAVLGCQCCARLSVLCCAVNAVLSVLCCQCCAVGAVLCCVVLSVLCCQCCAVSAVLSVLCCAGSAVHQCCAVYCFIAASHHICMCRHTDVQCWLQCKSTLHTISFLSACYCGSHTISNTVGTSKMISGMGVSSIVSQTFSALQDLHG